MNEPIGPFVIRFVKNQKGCGARVFVNGDEIPGDRLISVASKVDGGCLPEVTIVYLPDEFHIEEATDDGGAN